MGYPCIKLLPYEEEIAALLLGTPIVFAALAICASMQGRATPVEFARTLAGDDRMGVAPEKLDVATAQPPQLGCYPLGRRATILVVCRQCGDGGNAEKLGQLAQQSLLIHGGRNVDRRVAASQRVGHG